MDKSRRRSTRKSVLRCGRRGRSKSLGPVINSDLCEDIPLSLPHEERLEKLVKSAFEVTMHRLEAKFNSEKAITVNGFISDGSKLYQDIDKHLKDRGLYKLAVAETSHERCDDINCTECQRIEEYSDAISRFQHESDQWNRLFSSHRKKLEDAVSESLDPIEHEIKSDQYCYASVRDRINDMGTIAECLVKEFTSAESTFACSLMLANSSVKSLNSEMSGYLNIPSFETPRRLIKHMTSKQQFK